MPRFAPSNISTKSLKFQNLSLSAPPSPKEIGKTFLQKFKNRQSSGSCKTEHGVITEFDLSPIEDRMKAYKKGFSQRSKENETGEFDKIISNGYGTHNNECDYTLKLSLTPNEIRDSKAI
ncbi:hypothetical protein CONCODRAFT_9400 [Conidiobolus coronatus NRRL 28638]|uniref:Uncharacterized protein n=1 Tax=Conidiobolus coronatus (strain ATCC 28846 / CBS 209.66 / NRRL 28638) TaxID=796925 RepID=A0A137P0C7_CONC2|nr:hypothetical protein CONCODRAFT_9400 [Conidiobolus coronatus NRRL 28638]|eukprot:KXN68361.1 hypothetical protein CONCODRAFT_9400 [Conidiobolus coronatus NRRL 28638]